MVATGAPAWLDLTPDWRVALFAVGMAFAAAILFGLAPALQVARQRHRSALMRHILIGAQVAGELRAADRRGPAGPRARSHAVGPPGVRLSTGHRDQPGARRARLLIGSRRRLPGHASRPPPRAAGHRIDRADAHAAARTQDDGHERCRGRPQVRRPRQSHRSGFLPDDEDSAGARAESPARRAGGGDRQRVAGTLLLARGGSARQAARQPHGGWRGRQRAAVCPPGSGRRRGVLPDRRRESALDGRRRADVGSAGRVPSSPSPRLPGRSIPMSFRRCSC